MWGGSWHKNPNARAIILAQLHELAANYGEIPYFWIDMMNWAPKNLPAQEVYDLLKNLQPGTIVIMNQHIQDGTSIKYFPTDILNGEVKLPPAAGHEAFRTVAGKKYYLPFEFEPVSQGMQGKSVAKTPCGPGCWFTHGAGRSFPASTPFPPGDLYKWIDKAYDRGTSNVLLSCAPDHTGRMRKEDARQLLELGQMLKDPSLAPPKPLTAGCKATASGIWPDPRLGPELAFDDDPSTRWGGAPDTKSGWLAVDLGKPKTFRRVRINEGWDRVRKFELQIQKDDTWRTIRKGTTIGRNYSADFEPVTAQHVRLNILEATDVPTIWEVQLFEK
jgi:hypothetical protein